MGIPLPREREFGEVIMGAPGINRCGIVDERAIG
jgi:hypothetical protein